MEFFNNRNNQPPESKPKDIWRIKTWFPDLPENQEEKLKLFYNEILKFNSSLNIIPEKTISFADAIHFSDSIIACREIVKDSKLSSITDIGIGNGFPGIIMATLYPDIKVTIIDRDARKSEFIKQIGSQLKLKNLICQVGNIESLPPGSLDRLMTRGFAPISKAILMLRKQVKRGGEVYFMKSEEWATEVANIPSQLCSFWVPSLVSEYRLPIGEVKFSVVKLKKTAD